MFLLQKPINIRCLKNIAKIRLSAHDLLIERGRYRNLQRNERKCTLCNNNDIEDEFHFIIQCNTYTDIRSKYLKPYYVRNPSMFKFLQLLSTENVKELCNLGKYIGLALHRRKSNLI